MSDIPPTPPDEDGADPAAEYVLGVLEGPERIRAAQRLRSDPAFAAEVAAWERRLAPMLNEVAPVEAPPGVWDRVARSIEPGANVLPFTARPKRNRVGAWRAATAASMAAAAACVALLAIRPPAATTPAPDHAVLAATLAGADGKALYVATVDRARAGVTIVPVNAVDGRGRFPELWIIPAGGKPRPVGMISGVRSLTLAGAEAKATFAVSLEPAGGSPTGAPTGPVIATGVLSAV